MDHPYREFFKAMPCYLTVQDREFRIIEANDRFRKDFGDFEGLKNLKGSNDLFSDFGRKHPFHSRSDLFNGIVDNGI